MTDCRSGCGLRHCVDAEMHEEVAGPDSAEETVASTRPLSDGGTSLDKALRDRYLRDEPQCLQLQQDFHSLLDYTLVLIRENNALKNILKSSSTTIADTHNEFCQSVLYSTHELPHLRSLSYDGEDSSQARASESVTDTPMTATVNAIDSIKKLYRLTFEASTTSTHQQRRSSAATCSDMDEEPKFFTEDMLSLLTERISLKEEVAQLEENIRVIQRACESIPASLGTPPTARIFTPVIRSSEHYISDVCVVDYRKHTNRNVFVIKVIWSDGERFELYRTYGDFFTFHRTLQQLFPVEAGRKRTVRRVLPNLPNKITYTLRKLRKSTSISDLKTMLDTYSQTLLLRLPPSVSRAMFVVNFFKPYPMDQQLERLQKPRSQSQREELQLSVYPQVLPAGSLFDKCTVLVDYEKTGDGELTITAGEAVTVLKKEDNGWWLVDRSTAESHQIGYVPGAFLKPQGPEEQSSDSEYLGFVSSTEADPVLEYIAVEDYFSSDLRQISFSEGTRLILLEKSDDGWWLVAHDGQEGWAPANYIKAVHSHSVCDATEADSTASAQEYIANEGYSAQTEDEVSFPKGSVVKVLKMCDSGWWRVSFNGNVGVAPALLLTADSATTVCDISRAYSAAAIFGPPPRSKQRRSRAKSHDDKLLLCVPSENVGVQTEALLSSSAAAAGTTVLPVPQGDEEGKSTSGSTVVPKNKNTFNCTGSQCSLPLL